MQPENVRSAADAKKIVEERKLDHVKVGVFDNDGVMRGKYMGRDKFFSALDKGFGFCDVVLGWDSNDQLYDNVKYTGWHTAYPDAPVRVLPDTCRAVPFEGDMVMFLGEFAEKAEAVCPRATLRRVIQKAGDMGFPIEGLHTETGPGVLEAAIQYCEALEAADRGALFKTFTKVLAQRNGMMATFMAKWSKDWPGQSGHVHTSLKRKSDGKAAFHDASRPHNMSDEMRWYVGGQQKLMPELLAMVASTVNSYSRLIPGFWAPTAATWGVENRTTALRVIQGGPHSQRVEYRIAAADINPYLALAVAIGSGLHGIENKIEPDAMVEGNAYEKKFLKNRSLPRTLTEASEWLLKSRAGRALFGDDFVEHFAASREWEDREFRRAITDWELARYFEII